MSQPVNLHKAFSKVNEALTAVNDGLGVHRSFSVPYVDGQATNEHINAVGAAGAEAGGLMANLLTTAHRSGGRGYGSGDGETVGYNAAKLRETLVPENSELAIKAIGATKHFLSLAASLLGDKNPKILSARSVLHLIDETNGEGMNLLDFNIALQSLVTPVLKAVAKAHSGKKSGGHSARLRPPRDGMPQPEQSDDSTTQNDVATQGS
jgi:hypothetical protein